MMHGDRQVVCINPFHRELVSTRVAASVRKRPGYDHFSFRFDEHIDCWTIPLMHASCRDLHVAVSECSFQSLSKWQFEMTEVEDPSKNESTFHYHVTRRPQRHTRADTPILQPMADGALHTVDEAPVPTRTFSAVGHEVIERLDKIFNNIGGETEAATAEQRITDSLFDNATPLPGDTAQFTWEQGMHYAVCEQETRARFGSISDPLDGPLAVRGVEHMQTIDDSSCHVSGGLNAPRYEGDELFSGDWEWSPLTEEEQHL